MARLIYSILLVLGTPLILLRLLWRGRRQKAYLSHWGERWGLYPQARPVEPRLIWVHAVSVGETRAAAPLIAALRTRFPEHRILLTGMTPTGREAGKTLYQSTVEQAYLPYDFPGATHRFLRHYRPVFGILMETEVWPNLLAAARCAKLPVVLANARLSERSASGYHRFATLTGPAFGALSGVAAQTEADAARLAALGAAPVQVCGNLKFDVSVDAEQVALGQVWRQQIGPRPVWLAASTREGEEEDILNAWKRHGDPAALLILVPRHPQRFGEVQKMVAQRGFNCTLRSQGLPDAGTAVWLGDSMGEMAAYFSCADLAFIGGSLKPLGGQNLIEALACGCPVLIGPHTFNFSEVAERAIAAGAAERVADADALIRIVAAGLSDESRRTQMKTAGLAFAATHRGATEKTLDFILRQLGPAAH